MSERCEPFLELSVALTGLGRVALLVPGMADSLVATFEPGLPLAGVSDRAPAG